MQDQQNSFGPEWLNAAADRSDDESQAIAFRQMARDWNADKAALDSAHDENSRMQRQLDDVRRAASVPA
jgi:hypothetical protein